MTHGLHSPQPLYKEKNTFNDKTCYQIESWTDLNDTSITREEINKITDKSPLREKAFFTIMRQSGLPPRSIKKLKISNVEKILEPYTPVPCRITMPHEQKPIFIGHEAVNHLKDYLEERADPQQESLLFTTKNRPNREINTKDISRAFRRAAQNLKKAYQITREIPKGKPSELRLYSLKKFYEENAKHYLTQLKNKAIASDIRLCRKLYQTQAMPNLEIEALTPIQIHQLKDRLAHIERTIQETLVPVRRLYYETVGLIPEDEDSLLKTLRPDVPERSPEDREQRIDNALGKLVERMKEKDKEALAKMKIRHKHRLEKTPNDRVDATGEKS
jgi:hypothetical protein